MPRGHPNLRSWLHFSHNQEGDHAVHVGHVVALDFLKKIIFTHFAFITAIHSKLKDH
jgi:hypothetical protein